MLKILIVFLSMGIRCLAGVASAQSGEISEEYVMRAWDLEDGLPQNTVWGIAQTPDGYLWLATEGGVARFDGVRFTTFSEDAAADEKFRLPSNFVRALKVDRMGGLWLGLQYGGVARLRENHFETVVPVGSPTGPTGWVGSFAEDSRGAMWFGRAPETTAVRWSEGKFAEFSAKDGVGPGSDTFVHADKEGHIWVSTRRTCSVFDGTRFRPIDPEGGDYGRLAEARQGGVWAVRGSRLLRYFFDGSINEVADLTWLGGAQEVTVLFENRVGDLWLGTRAAGLWRFREGKFVRVPTSRPTVLALAEDREGDLWVGLLAGGLNRLRPQRFQLYDTKHGLPKEGVLTLVKDTEDRIWPGVRESPPVRALDARNRSFAPLEPWPGSLPTTFCADPDGGVWIGQSSGALLRWKDGAFTQMAFWGQIASLLRDREGNVWIATEREGLVRWSDTGAHPEPTDGGLSRPRALAEDSTGAIWVGTEEGAVFRRENGRFVQVVLPGVKPGDSIRFIVPDGPECVWIGTRRSVLLRWRAGRVESLPPAVDPRSEDLRALLIGTGGDFWMAYGRRLFRTTRQNLEEALAGRQDSIRGVVYGREDGLVAGGFTYGRRNTTAQTRDGHLWFATDRGCLEIDPANVQESVPLLPVLIEEMRVRGVAVSLPKHRPLKLPPRPGPMEIRYTLPMLKAPERLRFRYRLVGSDDSWVEAQDQRTASYPRLPAGNYRFEVAASEVDTTEAAETITALPFVIDAAWWETGWFRGGVIGVGVLALAALVRFIVLRRVRARMRMLEQQHALEKERARIARDMHDDLGASLTQITLASRLAKLDPPEEMGEHIDEIATIAQRTVTALDEIVWAVNPRNDTLPALLDYLAQYAVDFLTTAKIACEVDIPHDLPAHPLQPQVRHHLFLVVKEALNNIAKHARATTVQLNAGIAAGALRIMIADDGCGFAPGSDRAGSDGLLNMPARMAELGGQCTVESDPGRGTRVVLQFPLGGPRK